MSWKWVSPFSVGLFGLRSESTKIVVENEKSLYVLYFLHLKRMEHNYFTNTQQAAMLCLTPVDHSQLQFASADPFSSCCSV